jgi:hypothetical protein
MTPTKPPAPRRRGPRGRHRAEHGMVTAEMAVLLPALVLFTAAVAWLVAAGVAQVLCVDAARDAARALARAEPEHVAADLARETAPTGAEVSVSRHDGMVQVEVTYRATPPGRLLDSAVGLDLRATATTPEEVPSGPATPSG